MPLLLNWCTKMNRQLVLDAVNNLRKIAAKGTYRRLINSDLVDVEVHLCQILLEINKVKEMGLWEKVKKVIILRFPWFWGVG